MAAPTTPSPRTDYTAYFQRVAADRLGLMMEMEADRMRDLVLTPDEVATERDVILEERATRTDSEPRALFYEAMRAALFRNSPYGIPIIGWRREIEGLDTGRCAGVLPALLRPQQRDPDRRRRRHARRGARARRSALRPAGPDRGAGPAGAAAGTSLARRPPAGDGG